jgi:hypothetical protein
MNKKVRNVLTVLAIPVLSYLLLSLTFLVDALFQNLINLLIPHSITIDANWIPPIKHTLFLVLILLISFFILRAKKIKDFYKAVYLSVPTGFLLATAGLSLYRWPVVQYSVCALLYAAVILYLIKTKRSWMYFYSVSAVALSLLMMTVFGVEI